MHLLKYVGVGHCCKHVQCQHAECSFSGPCNFLAAIPAGVSFLPYDCGSYKQTPYESIDEAAYSELLAKMPPIGIDWAAMREMERKEGDDKCEYELACSAAGGCEMVDVI